ncbi:hypothetical protein ACC688_29070 [Rhizobium ruizarguesonis]
MAEVKFNEQDKKLYGRLSASAHDLSFAIKYGTFILKKELWKATPLSRGDAYLRQSAFVTAMMASYGRAFNISHGHANFPVTLLTAVYSDVDMEAHNRFKNLRNEVYAHTDGQHHRVTPYHAEIDGGVVITDMTGKPIHRLEREQVERLVEMSLRMLDAINTAKTGMKITQLKKQISK